MLHVVTCGLELQTLSSLAFLVSGRRECAGWLDARAQMLHELRAGMEVSGSASATAPQEHKDGAEGVAPGDVAAGARGKELSKENGRATWPPGLRIDRATVVIAQPGQQSSCVPRAQT